MEGRKRGVGNRYREIHRNQHNKESRSTQLSKQTEAKTDKHRENMRNDKIS